MTISRKLGILSVVLGFMGFQSIVFASSTINLYEAKVPVAEQNADIQSQAIKTGFNDVLARVSGDADIAKKPAINTALGTAQTYLQQFSYIQDTTGQRYLMMTFQEPAVRGLLQQAGEPVWGTDRPRVLAWVAIDGQQGKALLGNQSFDDYSRGLTQEALRMGLPLQLPLMDLEDLSNVSFDDVWQNRGSVLQKASARYSTSILLVGKITAPTAQGGAWQGNWILSKNGQDTTWTTTASSAEQATAQAADWVSHQLAGTYALAAKDSGETQHILLAVYGVNGLESYNKISAYLSQLSSVKSLETASLSPDHVIFNITSGQDSAGLSQAIAVDNTLVPLQLSESDKANGIQLTYQIPS